jgi:hypothetical protein
MSLTLSPLWPGAASPSAIQAAGDRIPMLVGPTWPQLGSWRGQGVWLRLSECSEDRVAGGGVDGMLG